MYSSIQLPWSSRPSKAEELYRAAGLMRTQGTIFMLPPPREVLVETFDAPPRPKTKMSSGAVALCKHFERGGASSEVGRAHPYWPLPKGSNDNKTMLASDALDRMLRTTTWRNIMMLHAGVAVYEIRNNLGYGMRWTIELGEVGTEVEKQSEDSKDAASTSENEQGIAKSGYTVKKVSFRGFLEPIEGLDHEIEQDIGQSEPCEAI